MIFKQIQHDTIFMQYKNYHMSIYRRSIEKEQGESLPQMKNSKGEDDPKSKCSKSQISWITTKPSTINTLLTKAQGEENTLARSILREKLGFRVRCSPMEVLKK